MAEPTPALPENWIVLRAEGAEFAVADILRAANFRGELVPRLELLRSKIACQRHATAEQLDPDTEHLQALADKFRYDRDLITSEETEAWLEIRGLDQGAFTNHLMRTYWHEQLGGTVEPDGDPVEDATEIAAQLTVEMLLGGGFNMMTRKLAWRMAARHAADAVDPALAEHIEIERGLFFQRNSIAPDQLNNWLQSAGADDAWFENMLAGEAAFGLHARRIVTPDRLARALRTRRLAFMRFAVEEIEFDTLEAAREAVLCVREDNLSMEEVAAESGYSYSEREFLLEEKPDDWQTALISTPEGALVAPIQDEEVVRLFKVVHKTEPSIEDPEVHARLQELVLESAFEELCAAQGIKLLV